MREQRLVAAHARRRRAGAARAACAPGASSARTSASARCAHATPRPPAARGVVVLERERVDLPPRAARQAHRRAEQQAGAGRTRPSQQPAQAQAHVEAVRGEQRVAVRTLTQHQAGDARACRRPADCEPAPRGLESARAAPAAGSREAAKRGTSTRGEQRQDEDGGERDRGTAEDVRASACRSLTGAEDGCIRPAAGRSGARHPARGPRERAAHSRDDQGLRGGGVRQATFAARASCHSRHSCGASVTNEVWRGTQPSSRRALRRRHLRVVEQRLAVRAERAHQVLGRPRLRGHAGGERGRARPAASPCGANRRRAGSARRACRARAPARRRPRRRRGAPWPSAASRRRGR